MLKQLAVVAILCSGLMLDAQTNRTHAASPDAVCSFITGKMTSALQQVPTLCTGEKSLSGNLRINVFAAKNVFQTDLRRAWSSALFEAMQSIQKDKSQRDSCFVGSSKCIIEIADSNMAESGLHYRLILDDDWIGAVKSHGPDFSEDWYKLWWLELTLGKKADHSQSKESAESLAKIACDAYQKESEPWAHAFNRQIPTCSAMVATDEALVIVIDYDDFMLALEEGNARYVLESIGKTLDDTAYKGTVIIRSPWMKRDDGSETRIYKMYDLGGIEFAYEEFHSGTRSEVSAETLLSGDFRTIGQTDSNKFNDDASSQYIVREAPSPDGATFIDTSDGAEWKATAVSMARCPFAVGNSVYAMKAEKLIMFGYLGMESCQIDVSFVKGW
jgi:hypothetical protein